MKKFTKGALITCFVLFITAVLFIIAGVSTSGIGVFKTGFKTLHEKTWFQDWQGFNFSLPFSDDDWEGWGKEDYSKGEKKEYAYDEDQVQQLSIDATFAKLDVQESDHNQLEIFIDGEKSKVSYNCKETNGEVMITAKHKPKTINLSKDKALIIKVLLPKEMTLSNLSIDVAAGEVALNLPSVQLNDLELDVAAGELTVINLKGNNANIEVSAGQMIAETIKMDTCLINCGMGNIEIKDLEIAEKLEAEVGMGNITINLNGEKIDYNYELACGMGNLTIGKEEYSGLGKDTKIDNQAMIDVKLECGMGNLEIFFN